MGLMDKFKNLFTEEVEEEVVKPIKKEVRHVEIPSPKRETREIKTESVSEKISDSVAINKEDKISFPLYFDDKDFDDLEKPKKEQRPVKKEIPKSEAYQGTKVQKVEQRRFEASPIISPVYGVLDKNYRKEDIPTRKEQPDDYTRRPRRVTVDDIRNKAFGTLEDDLEDTLFGNKSILFNDIEESATEKPVETGIDIFGELQYEEESKPTIEDNDIVRNSILEDTQDSSSNEPFAPNEEDMDEDTILLAKQLEEQKKKLEEINEYINESSAEDITDEIQMKHAEEQTIKEEKPVVEQPLEETSKEESKQVNEQLDEETSEDLTESELLNLVDAMYEKRDEE